MINDNNNEIVIIESVIKFNVYKYILNKKINKINS